MPKRAVRHRGGVVVLHAHWGLTASIRRATDRLSRAGFVACAPDLFDGATADRPAEAERLRRARRREPAYVKCLRAVDWVRGRTRGPVAVVGFSYGGHWALWLAAHAPDPLSAVVVYYASRAVDVRGTPVLAHFAGSDPYVSASARRRFEARLPAGSEVCKYAATRHGFAEHDRDTYDSAVAALAWRRTMRFLRRHTSEATERR